MESTSGVAGKDALQTFTTTAGAVRNKATLKELQALHATGTGTTSTPAYQVLCPHTAFFLHGSICFITAFSPMDGRQAGHP
eukprot:1159720-Pelagomonas_calceolata.AAC.13